MRSCEFCEISKNTFSYRTPPVAASLQRSPTLKAIEVSFHLHMLSNERVVLKILQNSQKNTCAKVSFLKTLDSSLQLYLTRDSGSGIFQRILPNFWRVSVVKSILSKIVINCIYSTLINGVPHSCFRQNLISLVRNTCLKSTMKTL